MGLSFEGCQRAPAPGPEMYERRQDHAVALSSVVNRFLLLEDLNGDGLTDVVAGGHDGERQTKSPIYVFISQGDGSVVDRTSEYIEGTAEACDPVAAAGDVNNDGVLDLVIYDAGNSENPQHPNGGFQGEVPFVLLSGASNGRRWRVDSKLADAYQALTGDPKVHSKAVALGDVDGDGDLDIVSESQGGYQMIRTHIVINNGNDTWAPDIQAFGARVPIEINQGYPATYSHRHATEVFADLDHDGHVDLVMGQLRRRDNDQDALHSKVCWNPGNGYYDVGNMTNLPYAAWNDGWTYAKSLTVADLDGDGWEDLILGHERGNDYTLNNGNTGLYLQFLRNLGNRSFTDVTDAYFSQPGPMLAEQTSSYGANHNMAKVKLADMNGDGVLDLVFTESWGPMSPHQPFMAFAGNGTPRWTAVDAEALITGGESWYGALSTPIDLDGDGKLDILWPRLVCPGGNCAEATTELVPLLASWGTSI